MQLFGRKVWHFILTHSPLFYLYFFYYHGVTYYHLLNYGVLAQRQKIHSQPQNSLGFVASCIFYGVFQVEMA
jgi:hypothetical protein